MANNRNPVTGREVTQASCLEVPGGHVYFDDEDGLLWGDAQLPGGVDAGKVFEQLHGKTRPEGYKEYLAKLNGGADGLEAGTAADALDEKSASQVLITNTKVIDYAALAGFPGSVGHGAIEADGHKEVSQGRIDGGIHVGTLGQGSSKPAPPTGPDTTGTAAARAAADKAAADRTTQAEQAAADAKAAADAGTGK